MSYVKQLYNSCKELKNIFSLVLTAMLLALRVVLGIFANATLPIFGNMVKLSPAFLPVAATGAMFGPVPAALVGGLGDIISFLVSPSGMYFPGFTISGLLTGLIYGFAFYKNRVTLPRVIIGWAINMIVVETFLAALWLYMLYSAADGTPYSVYLGIRFISVAVKCVPEILLIFATGKLISGVRVKKLSKR